MTDDNKNVNETQQDQPQPSINVTDKDLLDAFMELKKTSVPKSQYDEKCKQNKELMECIIDGQMPEGLEFKQPTVDVDELRKNLFGKECTNLEYAENALKLRDELIRQGKPDPFLPVSSQYAPSNEDLVAAEKVAGAFRHCIEKAEGDSSIFTAELMRLTQDVRIPNNIRR